MLFVLNFYKNFINEENIDKPLMLSPQVFCELEIQFITPQSNSFITYCNTACSHQVFDTPMTEIESVVKPNGI